MVNKARTQSAVKAAAQQPKTYTVVIEAIAPVAFAVPGIRKAATGDSIIYHNKTGGPVKISVAADNVLQGVKKLTPKLVNNGKKRKFKVVAGEGTYEISVHYSYRDKKKNNKLRTGFALGASSPKIIIPRPGGF